MLHAAGAGCKHLSLFNGKDSHLAWKIQCIRSVRRSPWISPEVDTHTHRRTHTVFFDVSVICLCRAFRGLFQNIRQHWEDENGSDRNKAKICSILHGICTVSYSSCLLDVENLTWNKPQAVFSGRAEWTPRKLALILISYIAKVEGQHSPKTYVWHHSLYL